LRSRPDLAVVGGQVVGPFGDEPATVLVSGGTISAVGSGVGVSGVAVFDASGLLVAPGFIDLQCNGAHGIDLSSEPERLWDLAELLPRYGVTSFLPTIVSGPPVVIDRALAALGHRGVAFRGAEPLGLHLEGPMLNPLRRGAHAAEHLVVPSLASVQGWSRDAGVVMVTLAPELPGAIDVIGALRGRGVVVAAGHSDATARQAGAGIDAGMTAVTHLFNAMAPFGHREPGLAGVALSDGRVTAGLIADGIHVHPVSVKAAWAALGPDRLALVTDAVAALGMAAGSHRLGGHAVVSGPDGAVRTLDGRLAGSLLTMDQAVRNLVAFTDCSLAAAVGCATATPARVVAAAAKGLVAVGRDADLVLLTPDLSVVATVVAGTVVFDRDGRCPASR
jgi:N-acetylglucosamine-6-phosphate deacetylase